MFRPLALASLVAGLGACAAILGDFEVVADTTDGGASDGGADTGAPEDGGADAGPQPEPLDVAVTLHATCATLRYPTERRTYCWGAQLPKNPEYLGVNGNAAPIGPGFYAPQAPNGSPLGVERLFGTGTGNWFIAAGGESQGLNEAFTWGSNASSQSGQGRDATEAPNVLPNRLKRGETTLRIAGARAGGGPRHGCIVEDGKLYCWGQNDFCQASGGALETCTKTPIDPPILSPAEVLHTPGSALTYVAVAAGDAHTCALAQVTGTNEAGVYCFGKNEARQSGRQGVTTPIANPQEVEGVPRALPDRMEIAAGDNHTCAIVDRNKLHCWGANDAKQSSPDAQQLDVLATEVPGIAPDGAELSMLRLGGNATCVVTTPPNAPSRIQCFGGGALGRLGGVGVAEVEGLMDIKALAISSLHGCAIARTAESATHGVYCWGDNVPRGVDPASEEGSFATPRRVLFPSTTQGPAAPAPRSQP
ncbi:MAG: hypothetical protein KIT84_05875 [Labilithrix sp.]|nr:hypothetical protein [Labilithrix sp.]MCW5810518.1 hypothetical protein [Labilithrix sp.]